MVVVVVVGVVPTVEEGREDDGKCRDAVEAGGSDEEDDVDVVADVEEDVVVVVGVRELGK